MLQPFVKLEQVFIDKLMELQKYYLVTQSYSRSYDHFGENAQQGILISDYDQLGNANMHFNAVSHDKYAAILDLRKETHYNKLVEMMKGNQYDVYWGIVKNVADLKKRLDAAYKGKMRSWIDKNTNWKIAASDTVLTQFEVRFGELFLIIKWRNQQLSLKFEEIENC